MDELPDNSVYLMITSPPYNVMNECDDDLSLNEHPNSFNSVWAETYRALDVGYDNEQEYVKLANKRIEEFKVKHLSPKLL